MTSFSLLTLNCYGAPGLNTHRRLTRLAHELNQEAFSMVCLQEVQAHMYRKLLVDKCRATYPSSAYSHFIHAPKGGLLTLAQGNIETSDFVLYTERGLWYTPALADWILHKGVLIVRVNLPEMPVVVLNTHLTANYMGDWSRSNAFAKHEYQQLMQLAELVTAQPSNALVIACGDFNIPRGSWLYDAFLDASGMTDPLAGNTQPTFRPKMGMPARYAVSIDYALYRAPAPVEVTSRLRFEERVAMPDASGGMYLSDHYGVELGIQFPAEQA